MNNAYPLDGPGTVDVRIASSACVVTVGDTPQITVSVEPRTPGRAADEKAVANSEVAFADGRLSVVVPEARVVGLRGVQYGRALVSIGVPAGSALEFEAESGSLDVHGPLATLSAQASSGSIKAEEVTGEVGVDSSSGKVVIGRSGGRADITSSSGSVWIGEAVGELQCRTSSGKTVIGSAGGEIRLKTDSGRIRVESAGPGSVRAKSSSGSVSVAVAPGVGVETDLTRDSGKIRGDLAKGAPAADGAGTLRLEVSTSSGSIEVSRA